VAPGGGVLVGRGGAGVALCDAGAVAVLLGGASVGATVTEGMMLVGVAGGAPRSAYG
jgi:hypothetical protein